MAPPIRTVALRVPGVDWDAAKDVAEEHGTTRTETIRQWLHDWVRGCRPVLLDVETWNRFEQAAAAAQLDLDAYMDRLSRTVAGGVDAPVGG